MSRSNICRKQSPNNGNCSSCHPEVSFFLKKTVESNPGHKEWPKCDTVDFLHHMSQSTYSIALNRIEDVTVKRYLCEKTL